MFTLKLYRSSGPVHETGDRAVIVEVVGAWVDQCDHGVKQIIGFKKTLGVQDDDPLPEFYVGGSYRNQVTNNTDIIQTGIGGNYYDWAVLENSQGKTTDIFR